MPIIKATTITRRLVTLRTGDKIMTKEDFFDALWQMVKDTDVGYQELMDEDDEGGVYVRFTNLETEEMDDA